MAFSFRVSTNWCHDFPKLARESGFYFNMHRSRIRIDWNRISGIDIDRIIKERDFMTVDENINNVVDYCLESEYDVKILDANFVKLFRLAQLAVEYLLYCKQYLDHSVIILKDELRSKIEDNVKLKKELASSQEDVKHLKEQLKEKCKLLESRISKSNGEVHKCPYCPKTFMSALFVTAHVTRRHSYISDLCFPSSPVHDHYRAETEKLHSEIKTLKERLNQTERVIGKDPEEINNDIRISRIENKDISRNADTNDIIKEQGKKYQAEINSLKSILFDEIHNLKQKDNNVPKLPENTPDNGVKLLLNQQEKEIQRLREQLLERVTPDIESMHAKLQAQENFWKSKIEHLEHQHDIDIQNLTIELKETQDAANQTKAEYESKVKNLEKQSMNQSNILTEQRKQLNTLTREMNNSQIQLEQYMDFENSDNKKCSTPAQMYRHDIKAYKTVVDACTNPITSECVQATNLVIQDIDSVNSQDSANKSPSIISKHQYLKKTSWDIDAPQINVKEHDEVRSANTGRRKHVDVCSKPTKPISKLSDVYDGNDGGQANRSLKLNRRRPIEHIRGEDINLIRKSSKSRLDNSVMSPTFKHTNLQVSRKGEADKYYFDAKKKIASCNVDNVSDEESSRTTSESFTSDSRSQSDDQSVLSLENDATADDNSQHLSSSSVESIQHDETPSLKKISSNIKAGFDKKLKDLGIDPEWEGIPKNTFLQKIELVKHHQNLNAKKLPRYNQIKSKILEQVASRISASRKTIHLPKHTKKSPLDRFMTNVKSKAVKAFHAQKDLSQNKSTTGVKNDEFRRVSSKQTVDLPPTLNKRNSFTSVTDSPGLLSESNEVDRTSIPGVTTKFKEPNHVFREKTYPNNEEDSSSHLSRSLKYSSYTLQRISTPIKELHDIPTIGEPLSNNSNVNQASKIHQKEISHRQTREHNDIDSLTTDQESILTPLVSPKNKSVLKSATGSIGNLVKKKVLFDLDSPCNRKSLSEYTPKRMELNDSDWNISSISDEKESILQKEKSISADNIVLKTTQSDKIAEISKKIEEQLKLSRQKPVGAIEAMFLAKSSQNNGLSSDVHVQPTFSTMSRVSAHTEHFQRSPLKSKEINNSLPQPAPRHLKEGTFSSRNDQKQMDTIKDFDLDTDIDEILQA